MHGKFKLFKLFLLFKVCVLYNFLVFFSQIIFLVWEDLLAIKEIMIFFLHCKKDFEIKIIGVC